MHQHIDDDLESPLPKWIQRTAHDLDQAVADGRTTLKRVRHALTFLEMIEADEFYCPVPKISEITGRIAFFWPATQGGIYVSIYDRPGRCVINYEKDFGVHTRRVGGPALLRQELTKIYPFLKWRWERNTSE